PRDSRMHSAAPSRPVRTRCRRNDRSARRGVAFVGTSRGSWYGSGGLILQLIITFKSSPKKGDFPCDVGHTSLRLPSPTVGANTDELVVVVDELEVVLGGNVTLQHLERLELELDHPTAVPA